MPSVVGTLRFVYNSRIRESASRTELKLTTTTNLLSKCKCFPTMKTDIATNQPEAFKAL